MKKLSTLLLLLAFAPLSYSQKFTPSGTKKAQGKETASDKEKGINAYEKLNPLLGGDSIRNSRKGYACQGWVEDRYPGGALLHKGLYENGQLTFYRNYFENGTIERVFRKLPDGTTKLQCFYSNGNLRSDVEYVNGKPRHIQQFYANGITKYVEQYDPTITYLLEKSSYFRNGDPETEFQIKDQKLMIYHQMEFAADGSLRQEGDLKFNNGIARFTREQYVRDGYWKIYNDDGIVAQEMFYLNGMPSDPSKVSTSSAKTKKK